jgi:hypothetical protein
MIIDTILSIKKLKQPTPDGRDEEMIFSRKWIPLMSEYRANGGECFFYIGDVNSFQYTVFEYEKRRGLKIMKEKDIFKSPGQIELLIDDVSISAKFISVVEIKPVKALEYWAFSQAKLYGYRPIN